MVKIKGLFTVSLGLICVSLVEAQETQLSIEQALIETPTISTVALAPNGKSVVYTVVRRSVAQNHWKMEMFLQAIGSDGAPRGSAELLHEVTDDGPASFNERWCPNSRCITYRRGKELIRYDLFSRELIPLTVNDTRELTFIVGAVKGKQRLRIKAIGGNYQWSPSGKSIAFTAAPTSEGQWLDPKKGTVVTPRFSGGAVNSALFVLDVVTGQVKQVSPDTLHVTGFDWSPDERAFVVETEKYRSRFYSITDHDLAIIDIPTRSVKSLVNRPGEDTGPVWSPDGKWIAFEHMAEPLRYLGAWPAMVSAEGGPIVRLAHDSDPMAGQGADERLVWAADSRELFYSNQWYGVIEPFRVDIGARRVYPLLAEKGYSKRRVSFSSDRRRVAFIRSSAVEVPELVVQDLPLGKPRVVTSLGASYPHGVQILSRLRVDTVSWPSSDGKFTVHGLLYTPHSAWRAGSIGLTGVQAPLPTVVYNRGGPSGVSNIFAGAGQGGCSVLALAARGYAVLEPATRTHPGWGIEFVRSESFTMKGYEDMMAGINMLIQKGITDPVRLGVCGHSYGANLTELAITQTNRFKAAVIHEATTTDNTGGLFAMSGSTMELAARDRYGMAGDFSPSDMKKLIDESPLFHFHKISTPTMLIFGAHGTSVEPIGVRLSTVFNRMNIPFEFVLMDGGHVTTHPAGYLDELARSGAWFDYWLKGIPYPNEARTREFDAWRLGKNR